MEISQGLCDVLQSVAIIFNCLGIIRLNNFISRR